MPDSRPDIFDRRRRAARRAQRRGDGYLGATIADQLTERLDDVQRDFTDALLIGGRDTALAEALRARGMAVTVIEQAGVGDAVTGEEDRLPIDPESVDLILWPGGLESVNDVPGALLRCRHALRPDGLLLGCLFGDGSFPMLRRALAAADAPQAVARMHPQIDLASLGGLLSAVGLALPVVDVERMSLAYRSIDALVADLRGAALTNMLAGAVHRLSRRQWAAASAAFADSAGEDGRTVESARLMHFSGWAPHASQPQPARRGSATASLAAALTSRAGPQSPAQSPDT